MANPTITGFTPLCHIDGSDVVMERVQAISNPTTAIFHGDCVTPTTDGVWDLSTAGAGNYVGSVCLGAQYVKSDGKITKEKYLPAGTTYTAADGSDGCNYLFIVRNPMSVIFEAYVDEAIAQTDLNLNYAFAVSAAGSTVTGQSGHVLDATGRGTGATLQWRVLGFIRRPGLDRTLTNARVKCMLNYCNYLPGLSTTGT